ncbi:cytochrome b561 [Halioglobus japonicus]|uniref:Hydrogenase n=1 Tax=Halioglobus japonicus TaxID=930805 RepID=A0AAP8SPE3_9GAMM|nr:cytochrome b/b6 domain-containing protein [Halioglobus japonicus]PLW87587.1 hydrogenase [Halioglobus japonicus]GHD07668.1 cytochrome b561 [Halioglobus japonicus]
MHPIWDIPTRLFHWSLVTAVGLAWWSAETERLDVHEAAGITILVLVGFRLVWGVIGSVHSRFSDFVTGPGKILAYIRGQGSPTPGHNPLGAWSILALLGLLLLQAVSGLFNTDDVFFNGPLYYAVDSDVRDTMGAIHDWAFTLLQVLVGLHITVGLYHQFLKKDGMIGAMFTGRAPDRTGRAAPVPFWWAIIVVAILACGLWWGLEQAPGPPPSLW